MTPEEIRKVIDNYVALVETPCADESRDEHLALSLDQLALASHYVPGQYGADDCDEGEVQSDPRDYVEVYREAWAKVAGAFPGYGFFDVATPFSREPGDTTLECADAIDALADIYLALKHVCAIWEGAGAGFALEEFGFSYRSHWGEHVREVQLYLHARQRPGAG